MKSRDCANQRTGQPRWAQLIANTWNRSPSIRRTQHGMSAVAPSQATRNGFSYVASRVWPSGKFWSGPERDPGLGGATASGTEDVADHWDPDQGRRDHVQREAELEQEAPTRGRRRRERLVPCAHGLSPPACGAIMVAIAPDAARDLAAPAPADDARRARPRHRRSARASGAALGCPRASRAYPDPGALRSPWSEATGRSPARETTDPRSSRPSAHPVPPGPWHLRAGGGVDRRALLSRRGARALGPGLHTAAASGPHRVRSRPAREHAL